MSESSKAKKPTAAMRRKWKRFLEAFRKERSLTNACLAIQCDRSTPYKWKTRYPEFAEKWREAYEQNIDDLEAGALRRAIEGWDEPVFHDGEQCGVKRKFSTALTIFMLKANRKDKYFLEKQVAEMEAAEQLRRLREASTQLDMELELPEAENN